MENRKGGRPQSGNVIADNLKALRERRDFLKREIPRLLFAGCRKVPGAVSVQVRPLSAEEREAVLTMQRELRDIEATFRAFGA